MAKDGLAILIGGPKGMMGKSVSKGSEAPGPMEGGSRRSVAGMALCKALERAVKKGDGEGVMAALEEAMAVIDGDDEGEDMAPEAEDMGDEKGMAGKGDLY